MPGSQRSRRTPLTALVSAAAILVSVSTGIWAATLQLQVRDLTLQAQTDRDKAQRYDRVVRVLESRSLVIREMAPAAASTSARGTVYLDPMSGSGMVMVSELPWIRPDRAWQIWFVSADGQRRTGGLLRVDQSGTGYTIISVPNDLDHYAGVGITEEPATGSPQPTTPRIVGAPL